MPPQRPMSPSDFPRDPRNTMPDNFPRPRGFQGPESNQAQVVRSLDGHIVPWYASDSGYIPDDEVPFDDMDASFTNHDS